MNTEFLKNPVAETEHKKKVWIDDYTLLHDSRRQRDLKCPTCKGELILKAELSRKVTSHFAHVTAKEACDSSLHTAIIAEIAALWEGKPLNIIPIVRRKGDFVNGIRLPRPLDPEVENKDLIISKCESEYVLPAHGIIPLQRADLRCEITDRSGRIQGKVFIEVYLTNRKSDDDIEHFRMRSIDVIEINVSSIESRSEDGIARVIKNPFLYEWLSSAEKGWITEPNLPRLKEVKERQSYPKPKAFPYPPEKPKPPRLFTSPGILRSMKMGQ